MNAVEDCVNVRRHHGRAVRCFLGGLFVEVRSHTNLDMEVVTSGLCQVGVWMGTTD